MSPGLIILRKGMQRTTLVVAVIFVIFMPVLAVFCLQCFDTVGWAAGRASGL